MFSCPLPKEGMGIEGNDLQHMLYYNNYPSDHTRNLQKELFLLCNNILLAVSYMLRPFI